MKRSIPAANAVAYDSTHAFQTRVGKSGCPSTRKALLPVPPLVGPDNGGVVNRNGDEAVRPSEACASTQSRYVVLDVSPLTTAEWSTDGAPAAVHKLRESSPYATCDVTGSLVRHAIVAANGDSDVGCTSLISICVVETVGVEVVGVGVVGSVDIVGSTVTVFGLCFARGGFAAVGCTVRPGCDFTRACRVTRTCM